MEIVKGPLVLSGQLEMLMMLVFLIMSHFFMPLAGLWQSSDKLLGYSSSSYMEENKREKG